jgi:hypothetical protein
MMPVSKENICTCAGCGRSFKAALDTKIFKCASCQDLINATDDANRPQAGKIVCGSCWSGAQLRDQLWKTSEELFGETQPGAGHSACGKDDHSAALAELEAKLAVASDGREIALRERDLAMEVRQKLERTLADFLGKFAIAREAELKAVKEKDAALELARTLKSKIGDVQTQLDLAQETERDALTERNTFAEKQADLEAQLLDLEQKLAHLPDMTNISSRLSSARMTAVSMAPDGRLSELQNKLIASQEELARFREESEQDRAALRSKIADLHGELVAAQVDRVALLAEKEVVVASRHEADAKFEDLSARLARTQETLAAATKESESTARIVAREREDSQKAKEELAVLREAAIAALEPMAGEINSALQGLTAEAGAIRQKSTNAEDAESLDRLGEKLTSVRRQLLKRISMVLGVPAADSHQMPQVSLDTVA